MANEDKAITNDDLNKLGVDGLEEQPKTDPESEPAITKEVLEALKKVEIIELASKKGLKIDSSLSKADLINAVLDGLSPKPEAKTIVSQPVKKAHSGVSLIDGKIFMR